MRLAWFSPWPPQRSGVAGRSSEVVHALARRGFGIDVFVDERDSRLDGEHRRASDDPPPASAVRVQSAHDFVWRAARGQYELVVYQLGNSRLHEFVWPYLFGWPGLVVLHDARLHHARGRALLANGRPDLYRAEFARNHPDVAADAAELAVAGFDGPYYSLWPMLRRIVESSRMVAVHSRGAAGAVREAAPDATAVVEHITLGEGEERVLSPADRVAARGDLGADPDDVVFGVLGGLTAEKRLVQILRAFRTTLTRAPGARLVMAGPADPRLDVPALVRTLGLDHAVTLLGTPDDQEFDRAIAAVDVSLNLRWPSALETSGPWLRAIAAGRPTVIVDLPHLAHVPALDPRTWRPLGGDGGGEPIAVAIDILDEDHSLALALQRLAHDETLRRRLGDAARRYWEQHHTVDRMVGDYCRVIGAAAEAPVPGITRPGAFDHDVWAHTRQLLAPLGPVACELF